MFELLYLAIAALLVARIAIARLIIERLWRRATPLRSATILEQAAAISVRLGMRRNIAIRIADLEVVPMTWGSINPRVVLPPEALGWGEERWHSVLLHELGHVSRHDSLSRLAVETICAFYWLHPGMWLAARRLRLAQEQACDDLALTHGTPALSYARDLLDCASRDHRPRAALAMASTDLERRLRSILGEESRAGAGKTFLGLLSLMAAGIASIISAMSPVPAQSTVQNREAPQLQFGAKPEVSRTALPALPRANVATVMTVPPASSKHQPSAAVVVPAVLADDYNARVAQYDNDVIAYGSAVARYDRELDDYRAANDDYGRRLETYNRQMAQIGPDPAARHLHSHGTYSPDGTNSPDGTDSTQYTGRAGAALTRSH